MMFSIDFKSFTIKKAHVADCPGKRRATCGRGSRMPGDVREYRKTEDTGPAEKSAQDPISRIILSSSTSKDSSSFDCSEARADLR